MAGRKMRPVDYDPWLRPDLALIQELRVFSDGRVAG